MADTEVFVYVDRDGTLSLAGRLWTRVRKNKESATFEYDLNWLNGADRFSLEPALLLGAAPFYTNLNSPLFGSISDSAPDRWGRALMRRAERQQAEHIGKTSRTLLEIDYLLGVDDEARKGALRFARNKDGSFLAESGATRIPPLVSLPKLLSSAERVVDNAESHEDLRLLLAPGSSLGGARPKASVYDQDGHLAIAKFPHKDDEFNTVLWEAVVLRLAARAGISVSNWQIEQVMNQSVLLLRRFDRIQGQRIPFLSAMSMLEAGNRESSSYLEMVDALRRFGASPKQDMHELWRRVVFNVLISNTDDHLRNHAFLYAGLAGWRLSPAYDLNPVPMDIKPRVLTTVIDLDGGTASLDLAMSVAEYFELDQSAARVIAGQVAQAVATWRKAVAEFGLNATEIDHMASAFEHRDFRMARSLL